MNEVMGRVVIVGFLALAAQACSAGAEVGGSCDAVSCRDALSGGLSATGQPICDGASESNYEALLTCGCTAGVCAGVCGDNLCQDTGETSACGDCLDARCAPQHHACANDNL